MTQSISTRDLQSSRKNHQTYLELGEIQNNVYRQLEGIFDDQYEFARQHPLN